jgi:hypothetical protein
MQLFLTVVVLVYAFTSAVVTLFGQSKRMLVKLLALVALIATVVLLVQRDVYLPFLGRTFIPPTLFKDAFTPQEADVFTTIDVKAPNGSKVLYWAAEAGNAVVASPKAAYGPFANSGIAVVNNDQATLKFKCPTEYNVPWKVKLSRHVHYRVCCTESNMIGPVKTLWVSC